MTIVSEEIEIIPKHVRRVLTMAPLVSTWRDLVVGQEGFQTVRSAESG